MTRGARLTDAEADIRTQVVQLSWIAFTSTPKSEASQRTITLDADTVVEAAGREHGQIIRVLRARPGFGEPRARRLTPYVSATSLSR